MARFVTVDGLRQVSGSQMGQCDSAVSFRVIITYYYRKSERGGIHMDRGAGPKTDTFGGGQLYGENRQILIIGKQDR